MSETRERSLTDDLRSIGDELDIVRAKRVNAEARLRAIEREAIRRSDAELLERIRVFKLNTGHTK